MSAGRRLQRRLEARFIRIWERRGPAALALLPLAALYGAIVALRRSAFRHGWLRSERSAVPVIVVGNRIVGGAGKTPAVLAIVEHLRRAGRRPGIVSRGHGRADATTKIVGAHDTAQAVGDEPLLLSRRAAVPVVVGRRRAEAAKALLAAHPELDCIVADDGLQHLQWARDIEVVLFDARGGGNGWLLPAGPLREPIDAPSTGAQQLTLYSAGQPSTPLPGFTSRRRIAGVVELQSWRRGDAAERHPLEALREADLHACAGVAQPQRFFDMLRAEGLHFEAHALSDHDDFEALPWPNGARHVVVTEKDAVKLDPERLAAERSGTTVWVAPLDFEPEPAFWAALDEALKPCGRSAP